MPPPPPRALVLTKVLAGKVSVPDAALVLGLSERSIRRLRGRLDSGGPDALAHGNRGRQPLHTIDATIKARIVTLAKTTCGHNGPPSICTRYTCR